MKKSFARFIAKASLTVFAGLALATCLCAEDSPASPESVRVRWFSDWPAAANPAEIGRRVSEEFVSRRLDWETGGNAPVHYAEVCTGYGALEIARLTGDTELRRRIVAKFEVLLTPEGSTSLPGRAHVDDRVFGVVPLEIYQQTGDERFLRLGLRFADAQWEETTPDGITKEARYWVDDMYMISTLQVQAYRATGSAKYLDRAARTTVAYLDRLQQQDGLFLHTAQSPCRWARGNGWFAAGMTEVLCELPVEHPDRARILAAYRKMMKALLEYQSEEGRWRQLVDRPEAWPESSGSAMFAYALIVGVKRGWLEEDAYAPAARRAWLALAANLDPDAHLRDVCVGTGEACYQVGDRADDQVRYYLDRPRTTGDFHGQAPFLWAAAALLR